MWVAMPFAHNQAFQAFHLEVMHHDLPATLHGSKATFATQVTDAIGALADKQCRSCKKVKICHQTEVNKMPRNLFVQDGDLDVLLPSGL